MAPHVLGCPHCGKKLKLSRPPVAQRRVLCHGCSRTFIPATEASASPRIAAVAADESQPLVVVQRASAPATPQPEEVPLSSVQAPRMHRGFLLAAAGGLLLLLMGSTALALYLVPRSDSKREVPALASSTPTAERPTSA